MCGTFKVMEGYELTLDTGRRHRQPAVPGPAQLLGLRGPEHHLRLAGPGDREHPHREVRRLLRAGGI